MEKRYADIPAQGKHRGGSKGSEVSGSVRASMPPDPEAAQAHAVDVTYQHLVDETGGVHRVRAVPASMADEPVRGYTEMGRYTSIGELQGVLDQFRDRQRFVVFENTRSGEVYFDDESNVHDNWTGDGRFDTITVFNDQDAAADYVDRHRRK